MSAETIPADVLAIVRDFMLRMPVPSGYDTVSRAMARAILTDRATRPAEHAAPVAEAGEVERRWIGVVPSGLQGPAKVTRLERVAEIWRNQGLFVTEWVPATTIARLSEALAEAEKKGAEDWQPIETAPRDGTEFIAYREDQGLFACRWMSAEELAPKNWDGDPIGDYPEGRADWWHDVWGWLAGDEAPTLWQAYPAPPRDISQGGQP